MTPFKLLHFVELISPITISGFCVTCSFSDPLRHNYMDALQSNRKNVIIILESFKFQRIPKGIFNKKSGLFPGFP